MNLTNGRFSAELLDVWVRKAGEPRPFFVRPVGSIGGWFRHEATSHEEAAKARFVTAGFCAGGDERTYDVDDGVEQRRVVVTATSTVSARTEAV